MSTKIKDVPVYWNIAQVWNAAAFKPQKELVERDYCYASEIGLPFYDRYLKMKAVKPTNPPNNRSLRKFLAGNLMEIIVKQILISTGVYKHDEVKVDAQPYKGMLEVHGRMDFIAGGYVDEVWAMQHLAELDIPDYLFDIGEKIINELSGQTLQKKIIELKSCSSFVMDKVEKTKQPILSHAFQGYHYEKNAGIPADVVYICKDDARMQQFSIKAEVMEDLYREDIEKMTHYFKKKTPPPLDSTCKWDDTLGRFSKNIYVEYSPYLSHYGYETPEAFRDAVSYIEKWNRAMNRFVMAGMGKTTPTGKPIQITPKNTEIKNEIVKAGYKFDQLIVRKIELGDVEEETE